MKNVTDPLNWHETAVVIDAVRKELRACRRICRGLSPQSSTATYYRQEIRSLCSALRKLGYIAARPEQAATFRCPERPSLAARGASVVDATEESGFGEDVLFRCASPADAVDACAITGRRYRASAGGNADVCDIQDDLRIEHEESK